MKIKYQLAFILLGLSILVAALISVIFFKIVRDTLREEAYNHVEALSETKSIRLKDMIQTKHELMKVLVDNEKFVENVKNLVNNNSVHAKNDIYILIKFYKDKIASINEVHLIKPSGKLLASTSANLPGSDSLFSIAQRCLSEICIHDFFYDSLGNYTLMLSSPVTRNDSVFAIMLAEQRAVDIMSLTADYTGLGETGETILVAGGTDRKYLSDMRFKHGQGDEIYDADRLTDAVLQGHQGILTDFTDYRGNEVIASSRTIPELNWALITKKDKSEIMEPSRRLRNMLILLNIGVIFISIIVSAWSGKHIAKPLEELSETAREIQDGHYSRRVEIKDGKELKELGLAFNAMCEKLERKIKQLNNSNESLNKFAYIISHDLKSPLKSVQGLSIIMLENLMKNQVDEETKNMLIMIRDKTLEMEEMINQVLENARTGSADSLHKEWINVNNLIESIVNILSPPANITISVEENLPLVYYSKISMMQVFQNIISNSIKYNDKPLGKILITGEKLDHKIKFCIRDNGPGIKKQDYDTIFQIFKKGTEHKKTVESSGIGLSIVKKIVTENNGEIWVEPSDGEGAVFCFTVPAVS